MLKLSIKDFKHDLTSMRDECDCPIVSTFFGTTLGNWDEDWPFPVLWPLLGLTDLLTYWMQTPWWHPPLGFWIVLLAFQYITSHTKWKLYYDTFVFLILRFLSVKVHNNSCCIPRASLGTCLISVMFYSKWSFFFNHQNSMRSKLRGNSNKFKHHDYPAMLLLLLLSRFSRVQLCETS